MKNLMRVTAMMVLVIGFSITGCDPDDQIAGNFDPTVSSLMKGRGGSNGHSEKWIEKATGGDDAGQATGNTALVIAPNSIPQSALYTIDRYMGFQYGYAEFLPHTNFSKPALMSLDYSNFGLTDADVPYLKIYWYNEATATWEVVNTPTTVDLTLNTVSFYVDHISIYGFGR